VYTYERIRFLVNFVKSQIVIYNFRKKQTSPRLTFRGSYTNVLDSFVWLEVYLYFHAFYKLHLRQCFWKIYQFF